MRRFLQRAVREAPPGTTAELRMVYGGQVLRLRERDLAGVRKAIHGRVQRPNLARGEARRALAEALWRSRPDHVTWSQQRFAEEVPDRPEFEAFLHAWWQVLTPTDVLAGLADIGQDAAGGRRQPHRA